MELTVTFSPIEAHAYDTTCYVQVTGREQRLPLQIHGMGVGPQARFSYAELDIGQVFMNAVHHYKVSSWCVLLV